MYEDVYTVPNLCWLGFHKLVLERLFADQITPFRYSNNLMLTPSKRNTEIGSSKVRYYLF